MRHVSLFILEANVSKLAKDLYLRLCFLFPLLFTTLIIPISVRNYLECNAMQFNFILLKISIVTTESPIGCLEVIEHK